MARLTAFITAIGLLLTGSVAAQQNGAPMRPAQPEVRVQVNVSFFVPAASDNSDGSMKAQEDARKALYEAAAKECDLLRGTIANECHLESVGVNINRGYGQNQAAGFNANGNFAFKVSLK